NCICMWWAAGAAIPPGPARSGGTVRQSPMNRPKKPAASPWPEPDSKGPLTIGTQRSGEMDIVAAPEINQVVAALRKAAAATGSDFHYLLGTAMRESSLKPAAQSSTSSAGGLFQFIDQTWLGLVKNHGAKYGLGALAD